MTSATSASAGRGRDWLGYGISLLALVALIGLGYAGFRWFATSVMPQPEALNLYVLAVAAGLASFFSPCAFPLLPGYLAFYHGAGQPQDESSRRTGSTLRLGVAAMAGVATFVLVLGLAIALLGAGAAKGLSISGDAPSSLVRGTRGVVGIILIALGVGQLTNRVIKPRAADALAFATRPRRDGGRSGAGGVYLYGLGYVAAGLGCTGPILAGLVVFALGVGGFSTALTAFAIAAATMAGLMLLVSLLVGGSHTLLIQRMKASAPAIKTASGILLILVGLFNIYSAINVGLFVQTLFP